MATKNSKKSPESLEERLKRLEKILGGQDEAKEAKKAAKRERDRERDELRELYWEALHKAVWAFLLKDCPEGWEVLEDEHRNPGDTSTEKRAKSVYGHDAVEALIRANREYGREFELQLVPFPEDFIDYENADGWKPGKKVRLTTDPEKCHWHNWAVYVRPRNPDNPHAPGVHKCPTCLGNGWLSNAQPPDAIAQNLTNGAPVDRRRRR